MGDQLRLKDVEIQQKQVECREMLAELEKQKKAAARVPDRARLAEITDKSYSYISEQVNGNGEGKKVQDETLIAAALETPDAFMETVGAFLCALCGYTMPEKKSAMTSEEELKHLKGKIDRHGLWAVFKD